MNLGKLASHINQAEDLLKLSKLFYAKNTRTKSTLFSNKFSVEFKGLSSEKDYLKTYKYAISNGQYDFLLNDRSFIQFSCDKEQSLIHKIRYAYYQVPLDIPTYEEFLQIQGLDYAECGENMYSYYEQELDESSLKKSITPIRYDYDVTEYVELDHALSHIHIGHDNDIRIPISHILSPLAFVAFIIRHSYWEVWKKSMRDTRFSNLYFKAKPECSMIDKSYFSSQERKDLYLC